MKDREFLANVLDLIVASQRSMTGEEAKHCLESAKALIKWRMENPNTNLVNGLYNGDGTRFYGFSFQQLQYFVAERLKPKSVHSGYGIDSLLKWLWEVNYTSLGDIWSDLVKDVEVTFHRPGDLTAAQLDDYDKFWADVAKVLKIDINKLIVGDSK